MISAHVRTRWVLALLGALWFTPAALAAPVDFTLPGLDGVTHKLSDYRGQWVVVNYWATWCPPCREEIPQLERFSRRNRGRAVVLGIDFEHIGTAQLKHFVKAHGIHYPILRMDPKPVTALGPVWGLPTTYIVDPKGSIVGHHTGPLTDRILEEFIQSVAQSAAQKPGVRAAKR